MSFHALWAIQFKIIAFVCLLSEDKSRIIETLRQIVIVVKRMITPQEHEEPLISKAI
jgi:hypothetical protein